MAAARAPRRERKALDWVGTSLTDLRAFPSEVRQDIGHALDQAQLGEKSAAAKPLKGFGGAEVIYVPHAFQKKAKRGIATPKADLALIRERLKKAAETYEARTKERS